MGFIEVDPNFNRDNITPRMNGDTAVPIKLNLPKGYSLDIRQPLSVEILKTIIAAIG